LSWVVPFAFVYFQYLAPLEQLFMIDYASRSRQGSVAWSRCTAAHALHTRFTKGIGAAFLFC
jgi:hypothetical protein